MSEFPKLISLASTASQMGQAAHAVTRGRNADFARSVVQTTWAMLPVRTSSSEPPRHLDNTRTALQQARGRLWESNPLRMPKGQTPQRIAFQPHAHPFIPSLRSEGLVKPQGLVVPFQHVPKTDTLEHQIER